MTKFISIISGKGGAAKTTTAINLAAALNKFGKSSIVVDANLTTPNIGVYLGMPVTPVTLHDVLKNKADILDSVYLHQSGIRILPASISLQALKDTNPEKLRKVLHELKGTTDFVIIDSAAGLGREALAALDAADELLIITNPELSAVTDALKTIKLAQQLKKPIRGVVLAKVNSKNPDLTIDTIESVLEVPIISVIPEDRDIKFSIAQKQAVVNSHPDSAAAISYKKLAADLIGKKYEHHYKEQSLIEWMGDMALRFIGIKK